MQLKKENSWIPIRPHHGMCLAYFKGCGYSQGFARHMEEMLELFQTNAAVRLCVNTDEICSACPNNREGMCKDGEKVSHYDRLVLEHCGLQEGTEMAFLDFAGLVQKKILGADKRREICGSCQWNHICSSEKSRFAGFGQ